MPSLIVRLTLLVLVLLPTFAQAAEERLVVAVMELKTPKGLAADVALALNQTVPQALEALGAFRALSYQDMQAMLAHDSVKQALGCDDVSCLAELGGAIGAAYLITGSISMPTKNTYVLQLQLLDTRGGRVVGRASRDYEGDAKGLFEALKATTQLVARDLLAGQAGRLLLTVSEEGATIKIDNRIVAVSPAGPLELPGGLHVLRIEKDGFVSFDRDVQVPIGADAQLTATLVPSEDWKHAYRERAGFWRKLAYVGMGAGAALLVGGGVSYAIASGQTSALNKDVAAYNSGADRTHQGREALTSRQRGIARLDILALVGGGLGLAGLATGMTLWLTGDEPTRYDTPVTSTSTQALGLAVGLDGVTLRGIF